MVLAICMLSNVFAGTTGKIKGRITDTDGNALIGANVIIAETAQGAAADIDGMYFILNIHPGSYTVTASMIGYNSMAYEGVQIRTDLTTTLDIQLTSAVLEAGETVTVTARRPMVQKDATASASIIGSDVIESSPVESFQAIVATKAGVSVDAGGAMHFRGGRSGEIAYLIDGVPNINAYDGGLNVDISTNAIQELSLITGAFSAEYGKAMSGIVNIVTKDAGNDYSGSVSYMAGDLLTDYDIDIDPIIQEEANKFDITNSQEVEVSLSGPVPVFNKLKFFVSGRYKDDVGYLYGINKYTQNKYIEPDSSEWHAFSQNPSRKINLQGKFTYRLSNQIKLSYSTLYEDRQWERYSHTFKYIEEGHLKRFKHALNQTVKLTHQLGISNFYNISFGHTVNRYQAYAFEDENDPRYINPSIHYVRNDQYEFYQGGTSNGRVDRTITSDILIAQFVSQINNSNEIKFGFEYNKHSIDNHSWYLLVDSRAEPFEDINGDGIYLGPEEFIDENSNGIYDEGEAFTDVNGDGIYEYGEPFEDLNNSGVWDGDSDQNNDGIYGNNISAPIGPNNETYLREPIEWSAYIQDKIELRDMVINLGLRWDYYDPNAPVATDWDDPDTSSTKPATVKQQISPRFSIAYPVSDQGKLFFSYGHFFQMPSYSQLFENPYYYARGLANYNMGNPDLKPQKTVSYEVGFEQALSDYSAVYIKVFYRDTRDLIGQKIVILPSGSDSFGLYINRDWGNVRGVTFSFDQRFSNLISGSIDYTYQVAVGNESNPTDTRQDFHLSIEPEKKVVLLDWDQPHALRFVMNVGDPSVWRLNLIGKIESGYPYSPASANELIAVAEENSGRKPTQINVDMNLYFKFKLAGLKYKVFFKTYNLLDRRNENYVWDSSGRAGYSLARFGDESTPEYTNRPNWYSMPRKVYLGMSIDF